MLTVEKKLFLIIKLDKLLVQLRIVTWSEKLWCKKLQVNARERWRVLSILTFTSNEETVFCGKCSTRMPEFHKHQGSAVDDCTNGN